MSSWYVPGFAPAALGIEGGRLVSQMRTYRPVAALLTE
jgi:hypothetical protein